MTIEHAASLPSALAAPDLVRSRLRGRPVALFLDYDGTLTPIVNRPEDAKLSDSMRGALRALLGRCPVAIVSGRDRKVVEQFVGLDGPAYIGSHGFDIVGPPGSGIRREIGTDHLPSLDAAEIDLRERLAPIDGASVERKRFSIAAHDRLVSVDDKPRVEQAVDAVCAAVPRLRKTEGKAVFELRPAIDWDKGRAIVWLLEALGLEQSVPVHVGDDLTDEAAFEAIADDGIGILVADDNRRTSAQFTLRSPGEVERFLGWVLAYLTTDSGFS